MTAVTGKAFEMRYTVKHLMLRHGICARALGINWIYWLYPRGRACRPQAAGPPQGCGRPGADPS